jgi:hypothetical protein
LRIAAWVPSIRPRTSGLFLGTARASSTEGIGGKAHPNRDCERVVEVDSGLIVVGAVAFLTGAGSDVGESAGRLPRINDSASRRRMRISTSSQKKSAPDLGW